MTDRLIALEAERGATAAAWAARRAVTETAAWWRPLRHRHRRVGDDLCAAVAELLEVAGWITFDAEQQTLSHTLSRQALQLARACGHRPTAHLTLLNLSMQAAHLGRLAVSHRLATAGLETGRLPPRTEVPFRLRQARAYALAGRRGEALAALRHATSLAAEGVSPRDPGWTWWIDDRELVGHHGWAHAALREWDQAIPLLRQAVAAEDAPAYRGVFAAELLGCLLRVRAWGEAEELLVRLARQAADIGSGRARRDLQRATHALRASRRAPSSLRDVADALAAGLR